MYVLHGPCIVVFQTSHILRAERSDVRPVPFQYLRVMVFHEVDEAKVELTSPFSVVEYVTAMQFSARVSVGLMGVPCDDALLLIAVPRGVLVGLLSGRVGGGR